MHGVDGQPLEAERFESLTCNFIRRNNMDVNAIATSVSDLVIPIVFALLFWDSIKKYV